VNHIGDNMNIIKLANSIRSFAMGHYVPFMGFKEEEIIPVVTSNLPVSDHDVRVALEYICQKGV
jgi:hypothetical protein